MRRERNPLLTAYAVLVYAFLFAPIVVLIVFSFNDSRRNIQWRGFTLDWYPRLFANDELLDALSVTLQVAVVAVLVSVILGSLIGLGLARLQSRARAGADTLLLLPMVTPEIVVGLSLLLFFLQLFDPTDRSASCSSRTSRSASRTWRLSCAREPPAWTRTSKKRPGTSAPRLWAPSDS